MTEDTTEELERFRQQWQQEVTARSRKGPSTSGSTPSKPPRPIHKNSGHIQPERVVAPPLHQTPRDAEEKSEDRGGQAYHDLQDADEAWRLGEVGERTQPSSQQEPDSALEHYERACEKEAEGNLGDSLNHYRKAFRVSHNFHSRHGRRPSHLHNITA